MLNLTQHAASREQLAAGVVNSKSMTQVAELLTFIDLPTCMIMHERAQKLAQIVLNENQKSAMIGGAPFFMKTLETVLTSNGIKCFYAFSQRASIEEEVNGVTVKKSVFLHTGFVETA